MKICTEFNTELTDALSFYFMFIVNKLYSFIVIKIKVSQLLFVFGVITSNVSGISHV